MYPYRLRRSSVSNGHISLWTWTWIWQKGHWQKQMHPDKYSHTHQITLYLCNSELNTISAILNATWLSIYTHTHLCCSFRAGEVDHEEARKADLLQDVPTAALLLDSHLQHSVRARWRLIGGCGLLGALFVPLHQQFHDLTRHRQSSLWCVLKSKCFDKSTCII